MVGLCRRIAENEGFQSFILFLIVASSISLGLESIPELGERFELIFDLIYVTSQIVFIFEIAVRLIAFAPNFRRFFAEFWNTFDFVVVSASFLPVIGPFATVARVLRLLRVIRVISVSDRVRNFMERLGESFDEAAYAGVVLTLLGYIFMVSGHYLFVELDPVRWGTIGRAGLSVLYLALLQDVSGYIEPLYASAKLSILYFLLLYFVLFALLVSLIGAVANQRAMPSQKGGELD